MNNQPPQRPWLQTRLSDLGFNQLFILKELLAGPMTTRQLQDALETASLWRARPTFYRMMNSLEVRGLVTKHPMGNPKRYTKPPLEYLITAFGRQAHGMIAR